MKGSAGVNNKKFIKATSFDSVYKALLTEFYVNKFHNAKELENEYGLKPSTFSETKEKIDSAVPVQKSGYGEPITVSMFTECSSVRNPFFQLFSRCNDKDSEFYLYVLFAFWASKQIWNYLSDHLVGLNPSERRIVETAMKDAEDNEYNPVCCGKLGCSSEREQQCAASNICIMNLWFKMCGKSGEKRGYTKKELVTFLTGLFAKPSEAEASVKRIARMDDHTLTSKLRRLVDVGILKCISNRYMLSEYSITNILSSASENNEEGLGFPYRLKACIDFFSEVRPLGAVGYHLGEKIELERYRNPFCYKDRFVINAINDYNLIDILYAIEHGYALKLNGLKIKKDTIVVPLQVRISAKDGREQLICFSPETHNVQSIWLNHIHKTEAGRLQVSASDQQTYSNELKNAEMLTSYAWEFAFERIEEGNCSWGNAIPLSNVRAVLDFQTDKYMRDRFVRELRGDYSISEPGKDGSLEIDILVAEEKEVFDWLGAYRVYLKSYQVQKVEKDTVSGRVSLREPRSMVPNKVNTIWKTVSGAKTASSTHLFCPETGYAYRELASILRETIASRYYPTDDLEIVIDELSSNTEKMSQDREQEKQIQKRYADPLRSLFKGVEDLLTHREYADVLLSRSLDIPMTILERNWLIEVMNEPMSRLFLNEDEITRICDYLDVSNEERIFQYRNIVFCGSADNKIETDIRDFRLALQAVIQSRLVNCSYANNKNAENAGLRYWDSIYYSNRQNTFRLNAFDLGKETFRVDRLDSIVDPTIRDEVGETDRFRYQGVILEGLQYGDHISLEERKKVRIGLRGFSDEGRMRLLHELSAYTTNCQRQPHPISAQPSLKTAYSDDPNTNLPQVGLFPEKLFDYIVTLVYPGNDYIEIVDALCSYRNIYVLADRDVSKIDHGESKRQHSVVREILEREQKIIG